jgi:hypothetical protein
MQLDGGEAARFGFNLTSSRKYLPVCSSDSESDEHSSSQTLGSEERMAESDGEASHSTPSACEYTVDRILDIVFISK